jgi:hypothetical protein
LEAWQRYYEFIAREIDLHIIVDNGSELAYFNSVKGAFPESVILRNPIYRGHIAANNLGFAYALNAGAQYIGVLCPDFRLPPGTIARLCEHLDADSTLAGIASVVIKANSQDEVEYAGCMLDTHKVTVVPANASEHRWLPSWDGIALVDTMHGGFHLLRRSTLEKIGLQDERLFMYCDEMDFCWRAKNAGLKFAVLRSVCVWHEHARYRRKTPPTYAAYLTSRNRMLIMNRYGRLPDKLYFILGRLVKLLPGMLNHYRQEGTIWHSLAYALGLWHGILGVTGQPPPQVKMR